MTTTDQRVPDVLYVLKRYPRLSETFVIREILGLEAAGVRIGIDALLPPDSGAQHADVDRVAAGVRYLPRRAAWTLPIVAAHLRVGSRRPVTWFRRARSARRSGEWRRFVQAGMVADRVRRDHFHHVHAHFATAASEVARDAAALAGVAFTVTAHAKDIFHDDNAHLLPIRTNGAATIVTVSAYNVRHLASVLPVQRVRYVPNGLPVPAAVFPASHGPMLCVARLVPKKGIDLLVQAVAVMEEQRSLEIVGDGTCREALEALTAELGVTSRVRFLGALTADGVDAAYQRCSLVALPCRIDPDGDRDGMPTVLVEAMARGLPVVSTDVVGIDELIENGQTGTLVAPEDPTALAAALDAVLRDPVGAAEMGVKARERVIHEFAPAVATQALLEVFREAATR